MKKFRWGIKLLSFLFVMIFIISLSQAIAQTDDAKARYEAIRSQTSASAAVEPTNINMGVAEATTSFANGGFETGDFTGWEYGEKGMGLNPWTVCEAFDPTWECGYFMNAEPKEGKYDALNGFDGEAGYTAYLGQKIIIPKDGCTISYWDRIQYDGYGITSKLPRTYEVSLMQNEKVLKVLHHQEIMLNGQEYTDLGWQQRVFDVCEYAGQPVILWISLYVPEYFTGPAQIEFDDFLLGTTPQPPPSGCDLTPVLKALDLVEAKLDRLGQLPIMISDLYAMIKDLNKTVWMLETKLDRVQKELSIAREERAAIEAKLDEGEVVTQSDLADGLGGVWFPGAKKVNAPVGPVTPQPPVTPPK